MAAFRLCDTSKRVSQPRDFGHSGTLASWRGSWGPNLSFYLLVSFRGQLSSRKGALCHGDAGVEGSVVG